MKKIYIYLLAISLITTEAFCGGIGLPGIIQKKVKKLDEKIKLASPSITVISPNGGEVWQPGSQQTIRYSWTGNIPYVCIQYWNDVDNDNIMDDEGEVFLITSAPYPAPTGEYKWIVPNISSNRVKIVILGAKTSIPTDVEDIITLDMSDNFFTIGTTSGTTYYLAYDKNSQKEVLRKTPGPSGDWIYMTLYLYPGSSVEWKTTLTQNIIGDKYGFNITIRSDTDTQIKLEWILKKKAASETILATQDINNEGTSEDLFNGHIGTRVGINPNSGSQDTLIFRITHISGSIVKIVFDGKVTNGDHPYISVIH